MNICSSWLTDFSNPATLFPKKVSSSGLLFWGILTEPPWAVGFGCCPWLANVLISLLMFVLITLGGAGRADANGAGRAVNDGWDESIVDVVDAAASSTVRDALLVVR